MHLLQSSNAYANHTLQGGERVENRGRTVSLRLFVMVVSFFSIIIIALLLGLGLGLGLNHARVLFPHQLDVGSHTHAALAEQAATADSSSSFYGVPDNLANVAQLTNTTELDLNTSFIVSNKTQTREYHFAITQALASPDGFQRPMILVNGQFPGPLIEANTGDVLRVNVENLMSNWSTTVHFHGIYQKNTTWADGVASITQCGIPPGKNFTYEFTTDGEVGTFWYHSHLSTQYTDGLFGPIVIHSPSELVPQVDGEKVVFVGDWYHTYSSLLVSSYLNPTSLWANISAVEALADNILMNGKNTYNCSVQSNIYPPTTNSVCTGGELYTTKVQSRKTYRLRLINHSTLFSYWFSIDNHTIEIVELDGVEVEPIPFRGVNINIGQRYSVIVRANQTVGNYYMRATLQKTCFLPLIPYLGSPLHSTGLESADYHVLGILSYDNTSVSAPAIGVAGNVSNPYGAAENPNNNMEWEGCTDMPFDMPKSSREADAFDVSANNMNYITFQFMQAQHENRVFVNTTSWAAFENNASLWKIADSGFAEIAEADPFNPSTFSPQFELQFGLEQQLLPIPDADQGVQLVVNNQDGIAHPWHLHGHSFQIVGWGAGLYDPAGTTWNFNNPMRRDTVTIPSMSFIVIRWMADNPGLWTFHCHIGWHMEGKSLIWLFPSMKIRLWSKIPANTLLSKRLAGMLVQFAERPGDIVQLIRNMDPATRSASQAFCAINDDQAFGTYTTYTPPEDKPMLST